MWHIKKNKSIIFIKQKNHLFVQDVKMLSLF